LDRLQIERLGGLAGFGGPHLKSRGELALSALSPAERAEIEELFKKELQGEAKQASRCVPKPDELCYKITRHTATGSQEIVVPESAVPLAVRGTRFTDAIE
jgi:hypothetical protein